VPSSARRSAFSDGGRRARDTLPARGTALGHSAAACPNRGAGEYRADVMPVRQEDRAVAGPLSLARASLVDSDPVDVFACCGVCHRHQARRDSPGI
jgi:hypothetical protein